MKKLLFELHGVARVVMTFSFGFIFYTGYMEPAAFTQTPEELGQWIATNIVAFGIWATATTVAVITAQAHYHPNK